MRKHAFFFAFVFFSIQCFTHAAPEWSFNHLVNLITYKDVHISPDNQMVIFSVHQGKTSSIYSVPSNGEQLPTLISPKEIFSSQPRWSPDGKWISYLSFQNNKQALVLINTKCPETLVVDHLAENIQTYRWSPNSSKIAFVMAESLMSTKQIQVNHPNPYVNRLWLLDLQQSHEAPLALTPPSLCLRGYGDFGTANEEFDWSPKGDEIAFAFSPSVNPEDFYLTSSLAKVNVATKEIFLFEKRVQHESLPRYSPDGNSICFLASEPKATYAFNKFVNVCQTNDLNRQQLATTWNDGPYFVGPILLEWSKDNQTILLYEPKGTRFHIDQLPIDGGPAKELAMGNVFFKDPSLSPDGSKIGFIMQHFNQPPEVFISNLKDFQPKQLSNFNRPLLDLPILRTELITWKAPDGLEIEGLLTYPKNYLSGKKYPLLLVIHGGPMGFFDQSYIGTSFNYPLAIFSNSGFFVLRANPRGSNGYGKKFRWLNHLDLGGKDYDDLMSGVDAVINRGMADPTRLGVMGWSYGGYMTAWIISQTNRFKAASIGAGICNWISMAGTSDVPRLVTDYLGNCWENPKLHLEKSPVFHAAKVETPCLIQHGSEDRRSCVSQAYEYERALRNYGKEVSLVIYPGMAHGSNDPLITLDLMERNFNWFKAKILDSD